jgi:NAD(P)-dependent dehydrogenase (short-subunit alcohol dehydrogenase family)
LKGKHIVITGCTRGLGRALVNEFAAAGWKVSGCGRSKSVIEEMNAEIGAPHRFYAVDMASDADVAAFAKSVLSEIGAPDLFLNNAAIVNRNAPLWEISDDEIAEILDVNIKGVVSGIRHFTPAMIEQGAGVIVNFSSGWGRSTSPEVAPYCATKWAIEGLNAALSQELPSGLACVALNPGIIDTAMLQSCFGPDASDFPKADEWAKTAAPFLMRLSAKDNGAALTVG